MTIGHATRVTRDFHRSPSFLSSRSILFSIADRRLLVAALSRTASSCSNNGHEDTRAWSSSHSRTVRMRMRMRVLHRVQPRERRALSSMLTCKICISSFVAHAAFRLARGLKGGEGVGARPPNAFATELACDDRRGVDAHVHGQCR